MKTNLKRSILAPILIGLGAVLLLYIGNPIGPFLFAFGLLGVCILDADLFTGKAGYYWRKQKLNLFCILVINLVVAYIIGFLFSLCDPTLIAAATEKVQSWDLSVGFCLKSFFCGVVMYVAVEVFKRGSMLGVLFGVPLFIFCGFQHSIANMIFYGLAQCMDWNIILVLICAIFNLFGSIFVSILTGEAK